jgi:hypothetical protein
MKHVIFSQNGAAVATEAVAAPGAGRSIWVKRLFFSVETAAAAGTLRLEDGAGTPVKVTPEISLALAGHSDQVVYGGPGFRCTDNKALNYVVTTGGKVNFLIEYWIGPSGFGPEFTEFSD